MKSILGLKRYYLFAFLPLVLIEIAFVYLNIALLNQLIFVLSFIWPYALHAPGIGEKISQERYRFSFLRFSHGLFLSIFQFLPRFKRELASLTFPLVFSLCLWLVSPSLNMLFVFGGWAFWLIFFRVVKKMKINLALYEMKPLQK